MELRRETRKVRTGLRLMDCDHAEMEERIAAIRAGLAGGVGHARSSLEIGELTHFCHLHFAMEEALMLTTEYPLSSLHRLHHQRMAHEMRVISAAFARNGTALPSVTLGRLFNNHARHLLEDDSHFGGWLNRSVPD